MKKTISTLSMIFMLSVSVIAQTNLKKSVGVIRPHNNKDCETFFKSFASFVNRQGYNGAAEYIASFGSKSFSSCFVVTGNDGRYYAITNRHAVEYADSVMVQFIEGRDTITYDGLQIAGVSEELDLAAVVLPSGINFTPLALQNSRVSDGDEVFTAGFPGVSDKPSWQFGKGIVSNSEFYNEALTNDVNRSVIQHTAQIDAGSSGGPLLVKDGTDYKVAGVNTWKVSNRDGMNLSIRSNDIREFIATLGTARKESSGELPDIYNHLANSTKDNYHNLLPRLSYRYLFYMTLKEINSSFDNMPKDMRNDLESQMKIGHFTESLRLLAAYNAQRQMEENPLQCESITMNGNDEVILRGSNKEEVVFTWEKGAWRIVKIGKNASKRQVGRDASEIVGTGINGNIQGFTIQGTMLAPVTKNGSIGGGIGLGIMSRFTTYELLLEYFKLTGERKDPFGNSRSFVGNKLGIGVRFGGQIPIQVSPHITLVPNIKFRVGGEMPIKGEKGTYDSYDDDDFYLGFAPSGGINCMFKLATRKYLFLGASYEHKIMLIPGERNSMLNFGFIAINLGFVL